MSRVRVLGDGKTVADHERVWAWHQTISDPEHVAAAKLLRTERGRLLRPTSEPDVQIRCLDDYDTALGLNPELNRDDAAGTDLTLDRDGGAA